MDELGKPKYYNLYKIYVQNMVFIMETVNISELRANLLNYLKKAGEGQEILVTSHGQVLATIVAPHNKTQRARSKLDELARTAVIHDVISPTDEAWDVLS